MTMCKTKGKMQKPKTHKIENQEHTKLDTQEAK